LHLKTNHRKLHLLHSQINYNVYLQADNLTTEFSFPNLKFFSKKHTFLMLCHILKVSNKQDTPVSQLQPCFTAPVTFRAAKPMAAAERRWAGLGWAGSPTSGLWV
jgi:hypothetical protein